MGWIQLHHPAPSRIEPVDQWSRSRDLQARLSLTMPGSVLLEASLEASLLEAEGVVHRMLVVIWALAGFGVEYTTKVWRNRRADGASQR